MVTWVIFPSRMKPTPNNGGVGLSVPSHGWLAVCPGVVFHHGLGAGRESGCAADMHWGLVLHPWPVAPLFSSSFMSRLAPGWGAA